MKHSLQLSISARSGKSYAAFLDKKLRQAHALIHPPLEELSLALVGERRMAGLHREFMGIEGATDVLTFELDHDRRGRVIAGEVIVCTTVAARQSRRRRTALRHELLLYALHGMLHLCGMNDKTNRAFAAMHRKEDEILTKLGAGPVFKAGRGLGAA